MITFGPHSGAYHFALPYDHLVFVNLLPLSYPNYSHFTIPNRKFLIFYFCIEFKRNAFNTTETELNAIAVPASHGAKKPLAAIGMPIKL